jgi:hypothetical protein
MVQVNYRIRHLPKRQLSLAYHRHVLESNPLFFLTKTIDSIPIKCYICLQEEGEIYNSFGDVGDLVDLLRRRQ